MGALEELAFANDRKSGDAALSEKSSPLLVEVAKFRASYLEKMDDDFNTGGAVSDLFELARAINRFIESQSLEESQNRTPATMDELRQAMSVLRELGAILGLFLKEPKEKSDAGTGELVGKLMELIIQLRANARKSKDFATSDVIRDGLGQLGISLQDLKEGTTWQKA